MNMYRATHASQRPQYGGRVSGLNPASQPITNYLPKLFIATYAMLSGYWEFGNMRLASRYTITACREKVKFKVSVWT